MPASSKSCPKDLKYVSSVENENIDLPMEKTFVGNSNPIRHSTVATLAPFLIKTKKRFRRCF